MSEVILTSSSLKDRLKGAEHTLHKLSSFITDLGRSPPPPAAPARLRPSTPHLCPTAHRKHQRQDHL